MSTKKCFKCQQNLPISEFYFRNKNKGTHKGSCKTCCSESRKKSRPKCKCGKQKDPRSSLCINCRQKKNRSFCDYYTATLGDKTYSKHKYAKYSYVRYYARKIGLENGMTSCINCGYNKHVEICHIKPVAEFSPDTKLTKINELSNLMPLCPNCHWEHDHGSLKIKYPHGDSNPEPTS